MEKNKVHVSKIKEVRNKHWVSWSVLRKVLKIKGRLLSVNAVNTDTIDGAELLIITDDEDTDKYT